MKNEKIKEQQQKLYNIKPIDVKFVGPVYNDSSAKLLEIADGYQVNVKFQGNLMPIISDTKLARKCGLLPRRSKVILHKHDKYDDITYVWYLFYVGILNNGQIKAVNFKNAIQAQIDLLKQNENTK